MMRTLRYLKRQVRMMWQPARAREGERLARQLADAALAVPSVHNDPEYSQRFLSNLFAGAYREQRADDRMRMAILNRASRSEGSLIPLDSVAKAWRNAIDVYRPAAGDDELFDQLYRFTHELAHHVHRATSTTQSPRDIGYHLAAVLQLDQLSFRRTIELLTPFLERAALQRTITDPYLDVSLGVPHWVTVLADVVEGYAAGARDRFFTEQTAITATIHRITVHSREESYGIPRREHGNSIEPDPDMFADGRLCQVPPAIGTEDTTILYSPIADLKKDEIVGSHATFPWTYPTRWPAPTDDIVDLVTTMESTRSIVSWCLNHTIAHAAVWHRHLGELAPFLRVDLPRHCVIDQTLVEDVEVALGNHEFPSERLQLGVWESSIIDSCGKVRKAALELGSNRVRLILNDLGVAVSRFDLLPRLYLQGVTIAPNLTAELVTIPRQTKRTVLEDMIDYGKRLDVDVNLHNVNSAHEKEQARRYGATNIQGHAVGQPQAAEDLEEFIREANRRKMADRT